MKQVNWTLLLVVPSLVLFAFVRDQSSRASESDAAAVTQVPESIPIQTVAVANVIDHTLDQAVRQCNEDRRNNLGGHVSCILLRNAVVTNSEVRYERSSNSGISLDRFPPGRATRHHMKQIILTPADNVVDAALRRVEVGYYQSPVKGAHWENAWHTIADFFVMLFHTVEPISKLSPVWFTRTGMDQLRQGCHDPKSCASNTLFDPFAKYFNGGVVFVTSTMEPVFVAYLVIGINTRCSPIATEDVGVKACQDNLRAVRERLLSIYDITSTNVQPKMCPTIHMMSRQGEKYRHITPFLEMNDALAGEISSRLRCIGTVTIIRIGRSMSFADQIRSVANFSVLIAGRGGGTALSIFLPVGGLYVSLSSFDRWSPYRDLVPNWIQLKHVEVGLVHHEDFRRPAQVFGSGKNRYVDPNRAAYLVKPREVATKIVDAIVEWRHF